MAIHFPYNAAGLSMVYLISLILLLNEGTFNPSVFRFFPIVFCTVRFLMSTFKGKVQSKVRCNVTKAVDTLDVFQQTLQMEENYPIYPSVP